MISKVNANVLLLIASMTWGINPIFSKIAIENIPDFCFVGLRFLLGAVVLGIVNFKVLMKIDRKHIRLAAISSLFLFGAFSFETFGLRFVSPVKVGFLVSFETVFIPVVFCLLQRNLMEKKNILNAFLAFAGLLFINFDGVSLVFNWGDLLVLTGALFYAFQVIYLGKIANGIDGRIFISLQLFFVSVLGFVGGALFERSKMQFGIDMQSLYGLLFSGVIGAGFAYFIQTEAHKRISVIGAGVIYSSIPLFGVLGAWIINNESLSIFSLVGIGIIILALLNSNLDISKLFRRKVADI
jgi:drug/metabolite transporter (DMT)-like permease